MIACLWRRGFKKKSKLFFTNECQLINVQGKTGLANHHFAVPSVITDSGKDHQCMIKPLRERLWGNRMFIWSQNIILTISNYLFRTEGKVIFLPWGNLVGIIIKEVIKWSVINNGTV